MSAPLSCGYPGARSATGRVVLAEVGLLLRDQRHDGELGALLDSSHSFLAVRGVAQHGGGEHIEPSVGSLCSSSLLPLWAIEDSSQMFARE